jgi:hypothetical protein
VSDACGKRAKPKGGVGAEKLTIDEMIKLIKDAGHKVPADKSRESLCGIIKMHKLNAEPLVVPKPAPAPAPVAPVVAAQAPAGLKAFIKAQNVEVIKAPEERKPVPGLPDKKLWQLQWQKLRNKFYNNMPKNGEYQNRMNKAGDLASKVIDDKKKAGEKPEPYYMPK